MLKNDESYTASTDMGKPVPLYHPFIMTRLIQLLGNVSFEVPSFHGAFPIPTDADVSMHHPRFAGHAATDEAHKAAMQCAKGMAMLTLRALSDPKLAEEARKEFEDFSDA